jgi:hypothetical protein
MLTLSFETENDAFRTSDGALETGEVARVLERVTRQVTSGYLSAAIIDVNGNTVGRWSLEDA